jgi:hypothetical protein
MGKRLVLWVLGYAWIAFLVGLGLLAMAAYSTYSAGHGGSIPLESALTGANGHIVEGREVTVERKRRRGGKTTRKYYELDLKQGDGSLIKLRIDHGVSRAALEAAIDEDVSVKYDAEDSNNDTYVIRQGNQELVSYADMAKLSQAHADADKAVFTSAGMMGFALVLALLGGGGLWWRRKLLAQDRAAQAAASAPVGIGENVKADDGAAPR